MTKPQKINLVRIILSAVLFAVAWALPFKGYMRLLAFLLPYTIIGYDVLWSAARNIARGHVFDENFLMAIATIGAFLIREYPEAAAVMLFYQAGELLSDIAVGKSRRSIAALMDIRPDSATVLRDGVEIVMPPQDVSIGDTIIVRPGERIPLDGVILEGETAVNTSALTGESLPAEKGVSDSVVSGSVNIIGVIKIEVQTKYAESMVTKILDLVENASAKKARTEKFITRFARYYTPCVVTGALLLAVIPPLLLSQSFSEWLNRALIFLVVSCPCALVISVPLSFFAGIGGASRAGILIKGADYMETLSKARIIVFDKTGTLTKGKLTVAAVHPEKVSEAALLDIAATAESYSNHPIASSIVRAHGGHIDKSRIGEVTELSGLGVKAVIDRKAVYAGNAKLMEQIGADWRECHIAGSIVHISVENEYMGHIVISDEIKPGAAQAISALKKLGISKTVMLTGDTAKVGEAVGRDLGIDETRCELLPDQKVAEVEKLLMQKPKCAALAFVGDGVNDAPVLSRSDVGIAMGALGSDAAIESADIVLMDDKLIKLSQAVVISRKTMRVARENIGFALTIKAAALTLGALGFVGMWVAVFADVGVMVLSILNSLRALKSQTR